MHSQTTVTAVRPGALGFEVATDQGAWICRCVVLASGANNEPTVPEFAGAGPENVRSVSPLEYRNPDELADGGVLIVGAAATGMQLAAETHASGRPVTVSLGEVCGITARWPTRSSGDSWTISIGDRTPARSDRWSRASVWSNPG